MCDRIATWLREDNQACDNSGTDGVTTPPAHIGENTVTWINDSEGRPNRAEADLSEVFSGRDRSSAETRAQREAVDRGVEGDRGRHLLGQPFLRAQDMNHMFPPRHNSNVLPNQKSRTDGAE